MGRCFLSCDLNFEGPVANGTHALDRSRLGMKLEYGKPADRPSPHGNGRLKCLSSKRFGAFWRLSILPHSGKVVVVRRSCAKESLSHVPRRRVQESLSCA
jgi:hypothetical protein